MSNPFIGEIKMFAGNFAPSSWALCDGQLISPSQNDALFALLGTIYGGDGESTFGLPDLRGRLPVHFGSGPGLSPRNIGARGGAEKVTLTTQQLPSHTHPMQADGDAADENAASGKTLANTTNPIYTNDSAQAMGSSGIGNVGGSQQHENLMPFLCVHFIIALFGVFPSET